MVERQEVEEILESALRITGSPDVDNDTLAALCRAWLAVDEAPVGEVVDSSFGGVIYSVPPELGGQRVRIVPVEGGE